MLSVSRLERFRDSPTGDTDATAYRMELTEFPPEPSITLNVHDSQDQVWHQSHSFFYQVPLGAQLPVPCAVDGWLIFCSMVLQGEQAKNASYARDKLHHRLFYIRVSLPFPTSHMPISGECSDFQKTSPPSLQSSYHRVR